MSSLSRRRFLRRAGVLAGFSLVSAREVAAQHTATTPYRFSEDRNERLPALAAELIASKVQLILASGTPASFAAKQATSTIPIVMGGLAADPVETRLVASLARPGGNITGMSMMTAPLGGKRLELLIRTVPGLARVAVFWNPPNPAYGPILRVLEETAPALRLKLQRLEVRTPADFEGAFETAIRQRAGALIAPGDPLVANRPKMVADIDLFINLKTARAMGLAIPQSALLQASHVIE